MLMLVMCKFKGSWTLHLKGLTCFLSYFDSGGGPPSALLKLSCTALKASPQSLPAYITGHLGLTEH